MQKVDRDQARAALTNALARRRGTLIGTPLQELYASAPDHEMPTKALTFFGYEMEVALPELVSCEIHAHGVIEPAVTALFIEVLQPGTVVFDVGAHLGYYSLLAAHLGATVHAFEPSRPTRAILERNACDGVDVISLGLWSEETTLRLNDFGRGHSAINTFLSPKDETLAEPEASYDVRVTTIDRHVAESGAIPQVIKIDVEGAEPAVLQGARRTIAAARPLITMEVGDTTASRTSRDAVDLAIDLGYVPYDLSDGEVLRPHVARETYDYGNLLLVPHGTAPPALPAL